MPNTLSKFVSIVTFTFLCLSHFALHAATWPQAIEGEQGTVTVYQPQPEALNGNKLTGRAAMSIELSGNEDIIWGVFWFEGSIETDRSEDSASISRISVKRVRWPDSTEADEARFTDFVDNAIESSMFTTSVSQLTATLAASEKAQQSLDNLKHDAPNIIFASELSVLLNYDGEPIFHEIENSDYLRAVNTPLAVAANSDKSEFYLTNGSFWYQASSAMGPWELTQTPPSELTKLVQQESDNGNTQAPAIISATSPSELISTDGEANWKSLLGGKLMYVENTETPWLREVSQGNMYVLLSGRWFSSQSQEGPWTFVRPDKLPQSFSEIPPDSDLGGLRISVAGTDEANDAVMDTQIPQTAAVKRDTAGISVEFDGEPKFEAIKGTEVAYALNTTTQVLLIDDQYYALEDAIWYTSASSKGPWVVADDIPEEQIAKIPPSSPVYNSTFVNVYGSTPEVVYVGYTPGYYWSYPYYGVPVYGTGWYYPPYYTPYRYYPYAWTWGIHAGYRPGAGWSYGVSWGAPFFRVGVSWGGAYNNGWYGGYHNHTNIVINNGGRVNIGNTININNGRIDNLKQARNNNIYKSGRVRDKIANNPKLADRSFKNTKAVDRANNVLADRDGNILRKDNNQWQARDKGQWQDIQNRDITRDNIRNNLQNRDINTSNFNRPNMNNRAGGFNHQNFDPNRMNRQFDARARGNMNHHAHPRVRR